jgi:GNAT superfamily N-acetyltransferase
VDPDHRRRGIGSLLVKHIVARMTQEGRTTMVTESAYPFERREDHPYRRFAEANGFTVAIDEIRRDLALPVDPVLLRSLADEAGPHHSAYRIESFIDDLPSELLPSFCQVYNQLLVDAPTGDVDFEEESMSPQLRVERSSRDKEMGRTQLTTVAIDKNGAVVAYTDLLLPPAPSPDVWQWGTLVHREHRGHRLGLALKVRNLQRLANVAPARRRVVTSNAEINRHMVEINERLGFQPIEVAPMFRLKLVTAAVR